MVIEKKRLLQWLQEYDYDYFTKERLLFEIEIFGDDKYIPNFQSAENTQDFSETYKIRCKIAELPKNEELKQRYNGHFYLNLRKSSNAKGEIYSIGGSLGSLAFTLYTNAEGERLFLNILEMDGVGYKKKSMKIKRKFKNAAFLTWLSRNK